MNTPDGGSLLPGVIEAARSDSDPVLKMLDYEPWPENKPKRQRMFSPLWLLLIPALMMVGGWIGIDYAETNEYVELAAKVSMAGADLMYGVVCFLIGRGMGRTEKE